MAKNFFVLACAASGILSVTATQCSVSETGTCTDNATCPTADGGEAGAVDASVADGTSPGDAAQGMDQTAPEDAGAADAPVGQDANDAGSDTGPGCDPTLTPAENACVISDAVAIFVAPGGSDTSGTGTMEQPVATIGKGIALAEATAGVHRVIACAAVYPEAVSVSAAVGVFGGVACPAGDAGADGGADAAGTAWTYTGAKAVLAPSVATVGSAVAVAQITGVSGLVSFEDIEIDAPALGTTATGASSVAVFVSGANVGFKNTKFVAQDGTGGVPGKSAPTNWFAGSLDGNSGVGETGGAALTCLCTDGSSSQGGGGGSAVDGGVPGPGVPAIVTGTAGQDGLACNGASASGGNGGDAPTNSAKTGSGAATYGTLSASGWVGSPGNAGGAGLPGQGGGGGGDGAGVPHSTGGGGGGACGGCGGAGGVAGGAGGSSIALVVYGSSVSVTTCTFVTGSGGTGGGGGAGEQGQAGSDIFGSGAAPGCPGGAGGAGSGGNGGGGGAGGIAAAIAISGTSSVTADGTAVSASTPPANVTLGSGGGPGGAGSAGAASASGQVAPQAGDPGGAATTAAKAGAVLEF